MVSLSNFILCFQSNYQDPVNGFLYIQSAYFQCWIKVHRGPQEKKLVIGHQFHIDGGTLQIFSKLRFSVEIAWKELQGIGSQRTVSKSPFCPSYYLYLYIQTYIQIKQKKAAALRMDMVKKLRGIALSPAMWSMQTLTCGTLLKSVR